MIKLKKYFLAQGHELALGELDGKLCLSDWIYSKNIKKKAQTLAKTYKTSYQYTRRHRKSVKETVLQKTIKNNLHVDKKII